MTGARRVAGCRRAALRVSRELFIGPGCSCEAHAAAANDLYTRAITFLWFECTAAALYTEGSLYTMPANAAESAGIAGQAAGWWR